MYIGQLYLQEKGVTRIDLTAIISHVLSVSNERVLMEPERALDREQWSTIESMIREREMGKPLAYLTNRREFYSESFYVDEHVLIPRPETELLVEEALRFVRNRRMPASVVDVGTGSGIIGTLLAKGGAHHVLCVDVSTEAIAVARKNAAALGVLDRMVFVVSDLLSGVKKRHSFDLVCANLPYVGSAEWESLMVDVRDFEPRGALVAGAEGFELYARLASDVKEYLAPGGLVLCEIGGEGQAALVGKDLEGAGLNVTVKSDLAGRERMVGGSWTSSS